MNHGEQKHFTFNHSNFYVERAHSIIYLLNYRNNKSKKEEGLKFCFSKYLQASIVLCDEFI